MKWLLCVLTACTHVTPSPPDSHSDGPVDALAERVDSGVDADANSCFEIRIVQCHDMLIELCIPFGGCAMYTCDDQTYGYCHGG